MTYWIYTNTDGNLLAVSDRMRSRLSRCANLDIGLLIPKALPKKVAEVIVAKYGGELLG